MLAFVQFVLERLEGEAAEKEAVSKAATQDSIRRAAAEHSTALQASKTFPSCLQCFLACQKNLYLCAAWQKKQHFSFHLI